MIDDRLREQRRKYIGCSDISSIVCVDGKPVSPWGTPHKVWMAKNFGKDVEETPAMEFGTVAEALVAEHYARETGYRCFQYNTMLVNGPICGNVDRLVQMPGEPLPFDQGKVTATKGLEVKTSGELTPWTEVPLHYQLQVQGYLYLVPSAETWDVRVLYRSRLNEDQFTVGRNPNFAKIVENIIRPWHDRYIVHFDPNDPPPAVSEEDCKAEYIRRKPDLVSIQVTDALYDAIQRYRAADKAKKEAEAEADAAKETLITAMANAETADGRGAEAITGYDGKTLCTWKAPKLSKKIDYKALVGDLIENGDIERSVLDDYETVSEGARRFLVK